MRRITKSLKQFIIIKIDKKENPEILRNLQIFFLVDTSFFKLKEIDRARGIDQDLAINVRKKRRRIL